MAQRLIEDMDPRVQRFFNEPYLERGMVPKGTAGTGFYVPASGKVCYMKLVYKKLSSGIESIISLSIIIIPLFIFWEYIFPFLFNLSILLVEQIYLGIIFVCLTALAVTKWETTFRIFNDLTSWLPEKIKTVIIYLFLGSFIIIILMSVFIVFGLILSTGCQECTDYFA